jgi:hypothetical protein
LTLVAERSISTALSDLVLAVPLPRAGNRGFWVFLRLENRHAPGGGQGWKKTGGNMARPGQDKFIKRQKELERIKKASEKMAKRQQQKKDSIDNIEKEIE